MCDTSVRRYAKAGTVQRALAKIPIHIVEWGMEMANHLEATFQGGPSFAPPPATRVSSSWAGTSSARRPLRQGKASTAVVAAGREKEAKAVVPTRRLKPTKRMKALKASLRKTQLLPSRLLKKPSAAKIAIFKKPAMSSMKRK